MLDVLTALLADPALPFVTSINGVILLIIAALQTVMLMTLLFMATALLLKDHRSDAQGKAAIKAALREWDRERAK